MLLDLLFPRRCVGCGEEGAWVCNNCVISLSEESQIEQVTPEIFSLYALEQPLIREALHTLKYNGVDEIGACLVGVTQRWLLVQELKSIYGEEACLVPVPTSKARRKQRGYNQTEVLAEAFSQWLEWPILYGVLEKRKTGTLVGKNRIERQKSMEGGFVVMKPEAIEGKNIVVLDDVLTTGATLYTVMNCVRGVAAQVKGLVMAHAH